MEELKMAQSSKKDYLRAIHERYHQATRKEKSSILEEFSQACDYNKKYAIWLLNKPLPENSRVKRKRIIKRPAVYSEQAIEALAKIWQATGFLCSQRLKPAIAHWMPWARKRLGISPDLERQIKAISPRQMDRRLKKFKQKIKRRIYGTTKPGSLLKHMILVRTDFWDVKKAGFTEIDLVSHSGSSPEGEFAYTLNLTDIKTTWVARQAILGKSKQAVVTGMVDIESRLPFALLGVDSDNGSEFINDHMYAFCRQRKGHKVQFTRSREYKKDDNAHIEQKNWTHVRKLMGWDRYDREETVEAMNALYEDLDIFQNLFQPSMKLVKKIHRGSRLIRSYDQARTPFDRVKESKEADPDKITRLQRIYDSTDPFELSQRIDQKLENLYKLAATAKRTPQEKLPIKKETLPLDETKENESGNIQTLRKSKSPWRNWAIGKAAKAHRLMRKTRNEQLLKTL